MTGRFIVRSTTGTYLDMSPSVNRHHWVWTLNMGIDASTGQLARRASCAYCKMTMLRNGGSAYRWCTGKR